MQKVLDALTAVKELIGHQYTGSSEAMSALQNAADDAHGAIAIMQAAVDAPEVARLTEIQRLDIVTDWFSDESDITRAMQMLTDFEQTTGITAPQERKPLTREEIHSIYQKYGTSRADGFEAAARAIEAAHSIAAPTKDTP